MPCGERGADAHALGDRDPAALEQLLQRPPEVERRIDHAAQEGARLRAEAHAPADDHARAAGVGHGLDGGRRRAVAGGHDVAAEREVGRCRLDDHARGAARAVGGHDGDGHDVAVERRRRRGRARRVGFVLLVVGRADVARVEEGLVDDDRAADLVHADRREIRDDATQVFCGERRVARAADVEVAEQLAARAHRRALRGAGDRRGGLPAVLRAQQRQRRRRGDDLHVRRRVDQRLVTAGVNRTAGIGFDDQHRDLGLGQRGRAEELVEPLAQPVAALGGILGRPRQVRRAFGRRRRRSRVGALHEPRRVVRARAGADAERQSRRRESKREHGPAGRPERPEVPVQPSGGACLIPVEGGGGGRGRGSAMPGQTNIMSGSRPLPVRRAGGPRRYHRAARTGPGSARARWPGTRR